MPFASFNQPVMAAWSEVLNIVRLHVDSAEGVPGSISSVSRRWRSGERPWAWEPVLRCHTVSYQIAMFRKS